MTRALRAVLLLMSIPSVVEAQSIATSEISPASPEITGNSGTITIKYGDVTFEQTTGASVAEVRQVVERVMRRYRYEPEEIEKHLEEHMKDWFSAFETLSAEIAGMRKQLDELERGLDGDDQAHRQKLREVLAELGAVRETLVKQGEAEARKGVANAHAKVERLVVVVRDGKSWFWVGAATAVVAAASTGLGVYFSIDADRLWDEAQRACPTDACPDDRGYELSHDAADSAQAATIAFAVAGVGLAATAVLWFLIDDGPVIEQQTYPVQLSVGPKDSRATLTTRF